MAAVRPFRAVLYARSTGTDITHRTAPPYDVISPAYRAALLAADPRNVVALELPEGADDPASPDYRYANAGRTWRSWRESGVLMYDASPSIYVLEQRYDLGKRVVRRRAFVAAVGLEPFSAGIVLPHERTLPKALADRLEITRSCSANLSPVFGLFSDPAGETDGIFEMATRGPALVESTDDDGVASRVWAIRDTEIVAGITDTFAARHLFIADGHHRYTTALAYRDERRAADASAGLAPRNPAYDAVMMALVNMDDPDLVVLPTHRVADGREPFDPEAFWTGLAPHFDVEEVPAGNPAARLSSARRPTFIVKTREGTVRIASLRTDVDPVTAIPGPMSPAWKSLDVAVLQELVLSPLLGIHPDRPETLERLTFVKDTHEALEMVGEHDVAFIMKATRMEQLRDVALGGETMPQKSTYFYPKLPSGLLFRSLD